MAYLKMDSTPAAQYRRMQAACQIAAKRARERASVNKKSYVITSIGFDKGPGLPFFCERPFGRG
jgi:hypothetical protein